MLLGSGYPGDPGGAGDPTDPGGGGGGGLDPPNPPKDPYTRGPDDPGGSGGPVDVGGGTLCSFVHTVSIQSVPVTIAPQLQAIQGVHTLFWNAGVWEKLINADVAIQIKPVGDGRWGAVGINRFDGSRLFIFATSTYTACPGQSLCSMLDANPDGNGDFSGTTCVIG